MFWVNVLPKGRMKPYMLRSSFNQILEKFSGSYHELIWKSSDLVCDCLAQKKWHSANKSLKEQGFLSMDCTYYGTNWYLVEKNIVASQYSADLFFEISVGGDKIAHAASGLYIDVQDSYVSFMKDNLCHKDSALRLIFSSDEIKKATFLYSFIKNIRIVYVIASPRHGNSTIPFFKVNLNLTMDLEKDIADYRVTYLVGTELCPREGSAYDSIMDQKSTPRDVLKEGCLVVSSQKSRTEDYGQIIRHLLVKFLLKFCNLFTRGKFDNR